MTQNAIFTLSRGPLTIAFLVLPQASILAVASALDPLRNANRQLGHEAFRWRVVSPDGGPVALTCGLSLPSSGPLQKAEGADMLIVVAGFQLNEVATRPLIREYPRPPDVIRFARFYGVTPAALGGLVGLLPLRIDSKTTIWADQVRNHQNRERLAIERFSHETLRGYGMFCAAASKANREAARRIH